MIQIIQQEYSVEKVIFDFSFRVSNTRNELNDFDSSNGLSLIDLGECENLLRKANNIPDELELIIIKKERKGVSAEEKDVQYDIYHPITHQALDMSVCDKVTIDLYVPVLLTEEEEKFYQQIIDQGYNPFDLGDKFYREICTPYNSENGTDVLLDDREEFFYYPIAEKMVCQNNCEYSSYSMDTKYMKCECGNNKKATTLDIKHLSKENIFQSFLSTLQGTNYKVMRCYNLVFNFKIFIHNYGSIITLLFFIAYIVFMIYYCQKEINPLKVEISKMIFDEQNKEKMEEYNRFSLKQYKDIKKEEKGKNILNRKNTKKKSKKGKKGNYPPKKQMVKIVPNYMSVEKFKQTENSNSKWEVLDNNNKLNIKEKKGRISKINANKGNKINNKGYRNNFIASKKTNLRLKDDENEENTDSELSKQLDNFELNNLDYEKACELDKRGFCKTYWSVLLREHLFIFTFITFNDYNLFYIKMERFLTLVCIQMTMNGLFFVHESMHRKYVNGEDYTFVQKIPQLLFTLIVSHLIEVFLCFLGMTDIHIYKIKGLPKYEKNGEKIIDIIDNMKNRLIGFYIVTFILFLFNWYFISAFCAVYQNTQKIFLRDTAISFATSMIDPFIIYGGTTLLRYISLIKCCKKKLGCVYKLSDIIPFF